LFFLNLLRPIDRQSVSNRFLGWGVFRLIFVAIMGANSSNYFAPLILLKSDQLSTTFKSDQLQALSGLYASKLLWHLMECAVPAPYLVTQSLTTCSELVQ